MSKRRKTTQSQAKIAEGYSLNIVSFLNATIEHTLSDGAKYKGPLGKDGLPRGNGRARYQDGSVYEGEWFGGKWHGEGVYSSDCCVERCDNWQYGEPSGKYSRCVFGEKDTMEEELIVDGKLEGEMLAGKLCGQASIEATSHCKNYRFLCFGSFHDNKLNGFGVQLNYFGPASDGSGAPNYLTHYCVGQWKSGNLHNGQQTQLQVDDSWLRISMKGGREIQRKSTVFIHKVAQKRSKYTIQAIKTRYRGYTFRSKTEARWAVLFTELNMAYLYEPYGLCFEGNRKYTCDFLLPYARFWIEIKGGYPTNDEVEKAIQLCRHTLMDVHIFYGRVGSFAFRKRCSDDVKILSIMYRESAPPRRIETQGLAECKYCGVIQICREARVVCSCDKNTLTQHHSRLEAALTKARYYDFNSLQ